MGMPVQDRLGAELAHDALKRGCVGKATQRRGDPGDRRVVDEHDPRQAFCAGFAQEFGEGLELRLAEPPRRHQRTGRHGRA